MRGSTVIRITENDDLETSEKFFKLASFWVAIGLSEDFTVISPKCSPNDKHHKSMNEGLLYSLTRKKNNL